jgi:hypothetical protein
MAGGGVVVVGVVVVPPVVVGGSVVVVVVVVVVGGGVVVVGGGVVVVGGGVVVGTCADDVSPAPATTTASATPPTALARIAIPVARRRLLPLSPYPMRAPYRHRNETASERSAKVAAMAVAALLAACGTDGPQARFKEDLAGVCAAHREVTRLDSIDGVARARANGVRELRALARLVPPRGDEVTVDRWLDQLRENVAALGPLEAALKRRDARDARRARAAFHGGELRARELARAYGVTPCAEG